jgi:hypothetical protein
MKKRRLSIALISLVFAAVIAVGGCGSSSDSDSGGGYSPVILDKPVKIVGDIPTDNPVLADFEADRVTNKVEDITDAKVLVINNDVVVSELYVSPSQFQTFFKGGGIVVLVEPSLPVLRQIFTWIGDDNLSEAMGNGTEPDIYAFYDDPVSAENPTTGIHTYVLGGPSNKYDNSIAPSITYTDEDGNEVTKEPEFPFEPPVFTKFETRGMLDHFIGWVNNGGPKGARERLTRVEASTDDVMAMVKAQTTTWAVTAQTMYTIDNDRGLPHVVTFINAYFVYAIHAKGDPTTNPPTSSYDYYIVDQEAQISSDNVYGGGWEDKSAGSHTRNVAYYLLDYYTDHYIRDADSTDFLTDSEVTLLEPSPLTTTGSTTLTTSMSYNFSGNLGFNGAGGQGGFSGGMTYSNSHTTTVPDIGVVYQRGLLSPQTWYPPNVTANARWTYQVHNLPSVTDKRGPFTPFNFSISNPPAISTSTAVFYNTWMWQVKNPSGQYYMHAHFFPRHAYTKLRNNGLWNEWDVYEVNTHFSDSTDYSKAYLAGNLLYLIVPPRDF